MKIIAYTALHYGSEYLAWAIRSVIDAVDEYWVLYAAQGSHGHRTDKPCPDTREQLLKLASQAAGSKLHWIDGEWSHEGAQRDSIHALVPDADVVLVLDADEIWPDGLAADLVDCYRRFTPSDAYHQFRIPMIHFWRSFYRCIVDDRSFPVRAIFPRWADRGEGTFHYAPISHMGYAQSPITVGYKQYTHGHKNEWRKDIDWFRDRYLADAQQDCHPVTIAYWNPVAVNPLEYMPRWMARHPYFGLEVIK